MENTYNELEDFLDEISTHVGQNTANRYVSGEGSNSRNTNKVVSALYEVASWDEQQAYLYQVFLVRYNYSCHCMFHACNGYDNILQ